MTQDGEAVKAEADAEIEASSFRAIWLGPSPHQPPRPEEGDRVRLLEPVRATWIDEDLAAEEYWEELARITADLLAGTLGVITRIRRHPTPSPYIVAFDRDPERGLCDLQITHCADYSLTPAKPILRQSLDRI
ncbi:hypothetical protein AB0A71_30350 [Kitasatospora aureofaciens]|uniref:hypothetical protein n=1 Tax=Kitasatospora aureofaciens TaxID=1894 RepID=UPI0033C4034B